MLCRDVRSLMLAFGVLVLFTRSATGLDEPCDPNDPNCWMCNGGDAGNVKYFGVRESSGANCTTQPFRSRCWDSYVYFGSNVDQDAFPCINLPDFEPGFPMAIGLRDPLGVPDLPPKKLDVLESTAPLLTPAVRHFGPGSRYSERLTHNDLVDLVTGVALYDETDFELPFGSAVFRHTRSYADPVGTHYRSATNSGNFGLSPYGQNLNEWMWDWNGLFWMMGENPILLIDSGQQMIQSGVTSTRVNEECNGGASTASYNRISYFIPDAHHAVPFIKSSAADQYSAPTWFDATLTHDDPDSDYYTVTTNNGAVAYRFKRVLEDVYGGDGNHHPSKFGWPYYALLQEIRDSYGNRVVCHYCSPDHAYSINPRDALAADGCVPCAQNCNTKGQLTGVELIAAGDSEPVWQLLYTYREFATLARGADAPEYLYLSPNSSDPLNSAHMLHSIHVHDRAQLVDPALLDECRVLSIDRFKVIQSFDAYDGIDDPNLPVDWQLKAQYTYEEIGCQWYWDPHCEPDPSNPGQALDPNCHWTLESQHHIAGVSPDWDANSQYARAYAANALSGSPGLNLLKAKVQRREDSQEPHESNTVYRYLSRSPMSTKDPEAQADIAATPSRGGPESFLLSGMRSVYSDQTLRRIHWPVDANAASHEENNFFLTGDPNSIAMVISDSERSVRLHEAADIFLHNYRAPSDNQGEGMGPAIAPILAQLGLPLDRTVLHTDGVQWLRDRRGRNARYKYRHFWVFPETVSAECMSAISGGTMSDPSFPTGGWTMGSHQDQPVYRWPYQFINPPWEFPATRPGCEWPAKLESPGEAHPFHVAVIDEYELLEPGVMLSDPSASQSTYPIRRRAIEMNIAGFKLRDRTWTLSPNGSTLVASEGSGEELTYDTKNRVSKRKTRNWSIARNDFDLGDTEGLILEYSYADSSDPNLPPGELSAVWIRKGEQGAAHLLQTFERDPDRPELVTRERRFPIPADDAEGANGPILEKRTAYTFQSDASFPDPKPIAKTVEIQSAGPQAEGQANVKNIKISVFNEKGQQTWSAVGSAEEQTAGLNWIDCYPSYCEYDELGRKTLDLYDTAATPTNDPLVDFERVTSGGSAPLEYATSYDYQLWWGVKVIRYPNGREQWSKVDLVPNPDPLFTGENYIGLNEQVIFKDLVPDSSGGAHVLSPITVNILRNHELVVSYEIDYRRDLTYDPSAGPVRPDDWDPNDIITTTFPKYGANGQIAGVEKKGADDSKLSAVLDYHASGQPSRSQAPDGTITRNLYDEQARLSAVYRGTTDGNPYWGSTQPGSNEPDNMVLIEKRYYGDGAAGLTVLNDLNAVGKLTEIRSFRDKPVNQYSEVDANGNPTPAPNNEDDIGWVSQHQYDWRQREVWVARLDSGNGTAAPGIMQTTLTWYDNLDRPRLVATYQGDPSVSSVDPRTWPPGSDVPTAGAILATNPKSLTETIYNAAGLAEETRNYRMTASHDPGQYSATITYYNHQGKPVEVHAPNSPVRTYVYDARGLQIASSSWAGAVEVERTETTYDADGRAIVSVHLERIDGTGGDALSGSNSVSTFTHSWYDITGKLLATVNYGTADATHQFVTGSPPAYDSNANPATFDGAGDVDGFMLDSNRTALGALCTAYSYDSFNRQDAVFHPDGTVTRYEFDDLGRQRLVRESDDAINAQDRRLTAYDYDPNNGNLRRIAAVLPTYGGGTVTDWQSINWESAGGALQVTEMLYGATVVDAGFQPISLNDSWVAEVRYPHRTTGQPDANQYLRFTYFSDGSVASREDALGRKFMYSYDELGRLTEVAVAGYAPAYPNSTIPLRRIDRIEFSYDSQSRPLGATAYWTDPNGAPQVVSDDLYAYDGFGNLLLEVQQHDALLNTSTSPTIDYLWTFSPSSGDNYNRLASMTYPRRMSDGSRRTIAMSYGSSAGDVDDLMSRVTKIKDNSSQAQAEFAYAGAGRRIALALGAAALQTFAASGVPGYPGLDQFGRVADLHYTRPSDSATIHQYEYAYDLSGNRTHARVTQWPVTPGGGGATVYHDNDRSYHYDYDPLQRLVGAQRGTLNSAGDAVEASSDVPIPHTLVWALDNLGNWNNHDSEAPQGLTQTGDFDHDSAADTIATVHAVNSANEIAALQKTVTLGSNNPVTAETAFVHDAVGNLVCDGVYYYQYDAWNRLMQVSLGTHSQQGGGGNEPLVGDPNQPWFPGKLVARYSYDGLGRLIARWTPLDPNSTDSHPAEADLRREDYYYDGVRRIQEAVYRPSGIIVTGGGGIGEGGEGEEFGGEGGGEPPPGAEEPYEEMPLEPFDPGTLVILYNANWEAREYVWGPDYVDECLFQLDRQGRAMYTLNDANYNVMALLAGPGFTSSGSNPHLSAANWPVLEQYVWSPYGELLAKDTLALPAGGGPVPSGQTAPAGYEKLWNRLGHQGLVFERFDAAITEPPLAATDPLAGAGLGLYQNRNRWYDAVTGRFTTNDALDTGSITSSGAAQLGIAIRALGELPIIMQSESHRQQYLHSDPPTRVDPTGLWSLPELATTASNITMQGMVWAQSSKAAALIGNALVMINLYIMMNDPDYAMQATSIPGGLEMLNYDIHALAKFGMSAAGAARAAFTSERLAARIAQGSSMLHDVSALVFRTGDEARDYLVKLLGGGRTEVAIQLAPGSTNMRYVDVLLGGIGNEVKMGFVVWSDRVAQQIKKDAEIARRNLAGIHEMNWHFFRSSNTGAIGADERVLETLRQNNIRYKIYE